jgi:hypothetical protein
MIAGKTPVIFTTRNLATDSDASALADNDK